MSAIEVEAPLAKNNGVNDNTQTISGSIIGIINPPPEVKNVVDKTASFVARNGPEFEAKIRQNEVGNPKFNFINAGDPYHAYYQHKVVEFQDGKSDSVQPLLPGIKQLSVTSAGQQKQQELLKEVAEPQFVPKEPPPDFEFILDPPSISAVDLDFVKLTAQFVARNGRQFLINLMKREQRNHQFDFLRPQHSLFPYFTKLIEQYTKILIPPKDLMTKLEDESSQGRSSKNLVLEQVKYRANWQKHQEAQKRREEEKIERETIAYAQIDWHDFVVVETVDYEPYEVGHFPPPTTPEEVGARMLMEERLLDEGGVIEMEIETDEDDEPTPTTIELSKEDNNQVQDMDEASSDEDSGCPDPTKIPLPLVTPPIPPSHDNVIVKKYDPKQSQNVVKPTPTDEYLISPITGEKIPASKIAEHMRIGLLDPRWVEQRDKHIVDKINHDNVFAAGAGIEASLKQLAERRTDIFGIGDKETVIGKKLGEEETKKDERAIWDGHRSSVDAVTRAARANVTLEAQIHQIHKFKGLLPDEEKEKIGPKPAVSRVKTSSYQSQSVSRSQASIVAPQRPIVQPSMSYAPPVPFMMNPIRPPSMIPPPFQFGYLWSLPPIVPAPPVMDPAIMIPDDEPPNKKSRSEKHFIPETHFISLYKSPITIQVQVPSTTPTAEWKLNGQIIPVSLNLKDCISALKAKIQAETGMPPGKQKISHDGIFFKDSNTAAYYNLVNGTTVHLQVKERGGRKK